MKNFATVSIAFDFVLSSVERADYIHLYSDYHKDAYGFRPRINVECLSDADLVNDYERFGATCVKNSIIEAEELTHDLKAWDVLVAKTISLGANDRKTALKWLTDGSGDTFSHMQDVELFVWEQGILFSDTGKALVKELEGIVTFEYEDAF